MAFTSLNFLIFFPLLAAAYWIAPAKHRWTTLLAGSCFFYITITPLYALLVGVVTLSTYCFAVLMERTDRESRKRSLLLGAIASIVLPLFFFKYFGAVNAGIIALMDAAGLRWPLPDIKLLLPAGISFYTFMAIGYTIDVYNEEIEAEKNIGILALFLTFFPLILSGPIERAGRMLPQFRAVRTIEYAQVSSGLKLMLWGYFMKLVVADRVGMFVDAVYGDIEQQNGSQILCAALLYPLQEYADFGGYSLIAIGTARIVGIRVMENFRRPFFATSMTEFWRRWHISLISWLTDYVFTPISFAFRRRGRWGVTAAIMITFLISGIWHGAALTFIVWGGLQGTFLSVEALLQKRRTAFERRYRLTEQGWYRFLGCALTYALFAASEVFTRAATIGDAFSIFGKILTSGGHVYLSASTFVYSYIGCTIMVLKELRDEFFPERVPLFDHPRLWVRYSSYLAVMFTILLLGVFKGSEFIYFQF